ncbi:sensor histidine kinase, partial [Lutibacter sp.]
LVKFSRLIRKFFDFSRTKFISLEQEISLLKNYLEIEKMRFGDQFNFQFNIDENLNLAEQKIPSMLLQPIVENAVNHGLFHNKGNGLIKIDFIKNKDLLIVQISDNGIGLKKAQEIKENSIKTHVSKSNSILKDRINLLNQSKEWHITYSINEVKNTTGTIVKLTFKHHEN